MKIISKFKDYYDYLQGIYGVDEKLVLNRTLYPVYNYSFSNNFKIQIFIGEYLIEGYMSDNKFNYGQQVEKYAKEFKKPIYLNELNYKEDEYYQIKDGKYSNIYILKEKKYLGDKSPTWQQDFPILIYYNSKYEKNPILKSLEINSFISSEEIYLILNEWLSKRIFKQEPIMPVGSDIVRLEQAGFDKNTSFRNIK